MQQSPAIRPTPLAEMNNVSRVFDRGKIAALASVSLAIFPSEQIALVGRSGSGKSTLINLLCGLDQPTQGTISHRGEQVASARQWSQLRATKIGLVFQQFHLLPTLTAAENIAVALVGRSSSSERQQRTRRLLDQLGLLHRSDAFPETLSGGERQRVAVARALAIEPDLIVADEPTGNLDHASALAVRDLLAESCRRTGAALLLATHDPEIAAICPRRVELSDGAVISDQAAAT